MVREPRKIKIAAEVIIDNSNFPDDWTDAQILKHYMGGDGIEVLQHAFESEPGRYDFHMSAEYLDEEE